MSEQKIILASVTAGGEAATSAALSQILNIGTDIASSIISSAPVILLAGLESDQAAAIAEAMAPVKAAGGSIAISAAAGVMGEINWPTPPNIAGRALESFKAGYTPPPAPAPSAPEPTPAPAPAPAQEPTSGSATAQVLCPHCGGHIAITATPGVAPAPTPAPAPIPEPMSTSVPVAASPADSGSLRTGPMDLEEFEMGVGGGSEAAISSVSDEIIIDEVVDDAPPAVDIPLKKDRPRRSSLRSRRRR